MTIEEEFNEWFEDQRADGLIDFKFDIRSAPACTTKEDVMAEILYCEHQIAIGNVEEFPPEPDYECHPAAEYIIGSCLFGTPIDEQRLQELMDN